MKKYRVAILGATGAVGQEMLNVLRERNFPLASIKLLASKRSAGKTMEFNGQTVIIEEATKDSFYDVDIVLSAVENELALALIPSAIKAGAFVVDNSSAYRLDPEVPLVVPEINAEDIKNHKGLVSNPNCSTIIAAVASYRLHEYATISSMIVSTYQAVSGAGNPGIEELEQQVSELQEDLEPTRSVFQHQIAFNLIPHIGDFSENGYTNEEMKMQNESRKIFHNDNLFINCTCVRVPVYRSHSESITLYFEKDISVSKAKELLQHAQGVKLVDDMEAKQYPMPLDTTNQDLVFVGRIRKNLVSNDNKSLTLWCCGDQVRKGAATNAVQIALAYIEFDH